MVFSLRKSRIYNLQYANDITLIALDEEETADLAKLLRIANEKVGLHINASKTKVMMVGWAKCLPVSTALGEDKKVNFHLLRLSEQISYDQMA